MLLTGLPAQQATFRSKIELVNIDVVVVDKDGNGVRGLKASDFALTDRKKPQTIRRPPGHGLRRRPPHLEGPHGQSQGARARHRHQARHAGVDGGDLHQPQLRRILTEFRSRYVLSFTPTGVASGGFHRLDVKVRSGGTTVKARQGYISGG